MKGFTAYAAWTTASLLLCACTAVFILSLNHQVNADLAMLHYSAWLINERSFVVYRDIFELNFPGPFLFHSLIGRIAGYDALPLRFVDLALLLLLGSASWKILSPVSRPAATAGFALFVLFYLVHGAEFVLERDYLALLPAVLAFAVACDARHSLRQVAITAALAAISCSMKPNAVVQVPVLVWMLWQQPATRQNINTAALFFLVMAITAAVPFAWVSRLGGLDAFIEIYRNFVPVYASSRYDLWHYDSNAERLAFLLQNYVKFGGIACLLALPGLAWAWLTRMDDGIVRRRILQLGAMTLAFTFYEVIAGKFWLNHMFPSAYWAFLCFALLLAKPAAIRWQTVTAPFLLIPVIGIGWLAGQHSATQMYQAYLQEKHEPQQWRARQIAEFLLQQSLQDNDRVQVLDMAGDGQAALLLAQATTATRHLIDVPLYMQPASAGTRALRKELISELSAQPPRFIVYFEQYLHPGGGNRLREFSELAALLDSRYDVAVQTDGYTIFRRRQQP